MKYGLTKRSRPEWIGKTPDSMPGRVVRLRIFDAHNGICHLTGLKIKPGDAWELDHKTALCNGGENRESNLAPALKSAHKVKTAEDVKQRAKDRRVRAKHVGAVPKKPKPRLKVSPSGKITDRETGEVIREAWKPKDSQ